MTGEFNSLREKAQHLERILHENLHEAVSQFLTDMQYVNVSMGATIVCNSLIGELIGTSKFLSPDESFYDKLINAHVENLRDCRPEFKWDDQCYLLGKVQHEKENNK